MFFSKLIVNSSFFFIFTLFFSEILKSATAAEKIATSTGKLFCVSLNICSAVSTFISLISLSILRFVGPDIKVV